jgi:hypothetical protein
LKRYRLFGRPDDLASRFNASAEGKLVLFYDEAVFAHDPKIRGKWKSEITEPWHTIEPKGIDAYEVRNRALRIFASNDAAPIAVDLDDRRVFVLEVADIHANDSAYFKALREAFAGEEMAAFVDDALKADLTAFETTRRNPPKTKAKADLADKTARPEQEFLRELFERDTAHNAYLAWLKRAKPYTRPVNLAELDRIFQQILGSTAYRSEPAWDSETKKKRRMTLIASLERLPRCF